MDNTVIRVNYLYMWYQDNQYYLVAFNDTPHIEDGSHGTGLKNVKIIFGDTVPNAIHIFGTEYMKNGLLRDKETDREYIINGNFKMSL